ncbi:MAG: hypothetical protein D3920_13410 [Candidatus Electrothrix sp. AW2]|nr:hypothetical protein [Candidatus Electrothrix gigas]
MGGITHIHRPFPAQIVPLQPAASEQHTLLTLFRQFEQQYCPTNRISNRTSNQPSCSGIYLPVITEI